MNIWVMNLKDNRDETEKPEDLSKFQFCLNNSIAGIGWGNETDLPDDQKSSDHLNALNALRSIKPGDLIWINGGEEYYIATAKSEIKEANSAWHKYDIANYIECDFYKIGAEIPEKLQDYKDKLVAHSTIQHKPEDEGFYKSFNDVFMVSYEKNQNIPKKKSKKTIILSVVSLILIASIILCFIYIPKVFSYYQKKTHPILPKGIEFGMTYDEIKASTPYLEKTDSLENYRTDENWTSTTTYDNFKRTYRVLISNERQLLKYLPALEGKDDNYICYFNFNNKYQLYEIYIFSNKQEKSIYKNLCDYYNKAFGNIKYYSYEKYKNSIATFKDNGVECEVSDFINSSITLTSNKYITEIPEISEYAIDSALNSISYSVSGFRINLMQLVKKCATNATITYTSVSDITDKKDVLPENLVNSLEKGDLAEYAATSFIITIHGDICQNPSVPYLVNEDVDIIKFLLCFDDYGNLKSQSKISEHSDLNTYAILTMFG